MTDDDHNHNHDHGHSHHNAPLSDIEQRVKNLEAVLLEKGLVDTAAMDELVDTYTHRVGPQNEPVDPVGGARTVLAALRYQVGLGPGQTLHEVGRLLAVERALVGRGGLDRRRLDADSTK